MFPVRVQRNGAGRSAGGSAVLRRHGSELTQVCDDTAVFVHGVLQALEGVVHGAKGENDFGQLTLQRLQLVTAGGSSDHTVTV